VKFGSANAVQFLLGLGPSIDLEYPYELALRYCNVDVFCGIKKHSPQVGGPYLANWTNKSKLLKCLVKHASVDINAIGRDGFAVVHIAAVSNHIEALKLLEDLSANVVSLGELGQTPAEIAHCNGYRLDRNQFHHLRTRVSSRTLFRITLISI
jgi:ankyrin repeat protein